MANHKETVEYTPTGKPKQNAWYWLLINRGIIFLFYWIAPVGTLMMWNDSPLGFFVFLAISIAIPLACIIHDVKWYKELVAENLIKRFRDSKLFSKI